MYAMLKIIVARSLALLVATVVWAASTTASAQVSFGHSDPVSGPSIPQAVDFSTPAAGSTTSAYRVPSQPVISTPVQPTSSISTSASSYEAANVANHLDTLSTTSTTTAGHVHHHHGHGKHCSKCEDPHERAGNPQCVAWYAKCFPNGRYAGMYVGGGAAFGGEPRYRSEGTWGLDYQGIVVKKRTMLYWTHGARHQGGIGAYKTDGPHVVEHISSSLHEGKH